jgi:hypothetical protein
MANHSYIVFTGETPSLELIQELAEEIVSRRFPQMSLDYAHNPPDKGYWGEHVWAFERSYENEDSDRFLACLFWLSEHEDWIHDDDGEPILENGEQKIIKRDGIEFRRGGGNFWWWLYEEMEKELALALQRKGFGIRMYDEGISWYELNDKIHLTYCEKLNSEWDTHRKMRAKRLGEPEDKSDEAEKEAWIDNYMDLLSYLPEDMYPLLGITEDRIRRVKAQEEERLRQFEEDQVQ